MTRIFFVSIVFGFFLGYVVRGHAAELSAPSGRSTVSTAPRPKSAGATYLLSAIAATGPAGLAESDSPDLKTGGNFREILAELSRSAPRWNFGVGFGFFAAELTGTANPSSGGSGLSLTSYSRDVEGEVARLSARYRLTDHLEAGLTADLLFGSNVSFSSDFFDEKTNSAWLGGTEMLYGFDVAGMRVKLGARYFASLGLPGRTLSGFQGVLETGVPVF